MFSQVVRLSYDIRTSVAIFSQCKFAKISQRDVCDTGTNVVRLSYDSLATYFGEKIHIKFLNTFKTFTTSLLHIATIVRDTYTKILIRMSCERYATKFAKQSREICMPVRC